MKAFSLSSLLASAVIAFGALPAWATDADDAKPVADAPATAAAAASGAGKEATPAKEAKDAAAKEAPKDPAPAKEYTIVKLGKDEIKNSEVEEVWKGLFPPGAAPDFNTFDENIRQNILRGLISERLIYQEAVTQGFDKSDEIKKRLANLEKQVIMQGFLENKSKNIVTDQQLHTAYAEKAAALKDQEEIRARHILVASEEEAKNIVKQLKKGGDFEKIAKDKSTDKGTMAQGGDLGYFTADRMVPEFSQAAFKLKKGEISDPVKTAFGWHVIKVEDRRKVEVPSYDNMKESLKAELTNKAMQDYVDSLLSKADITYYSPDGKTRDFNRTPKQQAKE
jgi:peptidyl-prolyl cis-trans isomerase C